MDGVLEWFAVIFVMPRAILRYSPLDMHREASLAYHELGHYMQALKVDVESKKAEWQRARGEAALTLLDDVGFYMSLRVTGKVPVRFVKRGEKEGLGVW
jgi:hypothetical protein